MLKCPSLLLLPVALIAFCAGWWLRPLLPLDPAKTRLSVVGSQGDSAPAATAIATKSAEEPLTSGAAAPFRSWAEIMTFLEDGGIEENPMLMQEGLARLLNTGAADLEGVLMQSIADPKRFPQSYTGQTSEMARYVLLFRWSMLAPVQVANFALSHPEWEEAKAMAPFLIGSLARNDPALAESLLAKLPEDERTEAATELHFAKAAADPGAFLQDPAHQELLKEEQSLHARIFQAWVKKSPAEAAAWFQNLPSDQQMDSLGDGLMRVWMSREPTAALAWLQALPNAGAKAELGKSYGSTLVQNSSPEAFAAALEKLPSDVADHVMRGAIEDWPDVSTPHSKSFLLKWLAAHPDSTEGSGMAEGLLQHAFQADASGQKALEFIKELPAGPAHDQALGTMSGAWAEKDPEAASKWVTSLPEGSKGRDLAAKGLVEKIQEDDPEGAMIWALSIKDEGNKNDLLKDVFENWLPQDPYGALKAFDTLSPALQEVIGFKR